MSANDQKPTPDPRRPRRLFFVLALASLGLAGWIPFAIHHYSHASHFSSPTEKRAGSIPPQWYRSPAGTHYNFADDGRRLTTIDIHGSFSGDATIHTADAEGRIDSFDDHSIGLIAYALNTDGEEITDLIYRDPFAGQQTPADLGIDLTLPASPDWASTGPWLRVILHWPGLTDFNPRRDSVFDERTGAKVSRRISDTQLIGDYAVADYLLGIWHDTPVKIMMDIEGASRHRLWFRLPGLPDMPNSRASASNLFEVKIPGSHFPEIPDQALSDFYLGRKMLLAIADATEMDLRYPPYRPSGLFPEIDFSPLSTTEITPGDVLAELRKRSSGLDVRVDEKAHMIIVEEHQGLLIRLKDWFQNLL